MCTCKTRTIGVCCYMRTFSDFTHYSCTASIFPLKSCVLEFSNYYFIESNMFVENLVSLHANPAVLFDLGTGLMPLFLTDYEFSLISCPEESPTHLITVKTWC